MTCFYRLDDQLPAYKDDIMSPWLHLLESALYALSHSDGRCACLSYPVATPCKMQGSGARFMYCGLVLVYITRRLTVKERCFASDQKIGDQTVIGRKSFLMIFCFCIDKFPRQYCLCSCPYLRLSTRPLLTDGHRICDCYQSKDV